MNLSDTAACAGDKDFLASCTIVGIGRVDSGIHFSMHALHKLASQGHLVRIDLLGHGVERALKVIF